MSTLADHSCQTAEIIALLYEATLGAPPPTEAAPVLNPTTGVQAKPPTTGLVYKKDASRPGGGVFVAEENADVENLPASVYVRDGLKGGRLSPLSWTER
jgi:hypothetical protein